MKNVWFYWPDLYISALLQVQNRENKFFKINSTDSTYFRPMAVLLGIYGF